MIKRIFIFLFFAPLYWCQNFPGGFNFNLPYDDTTSRKFLPVFTAVPLNNNSFVSVKDGHFSAGGKTIRFWGTNLVAGGAFPDKSIASPVAGRLRKMGFNLVRFHHMDNPWSNESLFGYGSSTRTLNLPMLDKFEYLIAQLKRNGVYANINLHVSRTFRVTDGVEGADSIPDYGKGVTLFDPYLIMLQKEFARQLLTHVNPYTGLPLTDDPVMAMVEIANENSLYRMWRDGKLKPFAEGGSLLFRHSAMLDNLWITFLKGKYSSAEELKNAWDNGTGGSGSSNKIKGGDFENADMNTFWILEQYNGASASASRDIVNPYEGNFSARVNVSSATGTSWHLQWKQAGLTFYKDSTYVLKFAARSDSSRNVDLGIMRDNEPYTYYNGKIFLVGPVWQTYSYSFKVNEDNLAKGRITFQFAKKGSFWFDNISLTAPLTEGLLPGEDLDTGNIRRIDYSECPSFSDQRVMDQSEFYIKVQNDYFEEMYDYLKNTLHVKVPLTGTNWNVGPADMAVQSKLDYIDNHAYWDHPSFPNEPWSPYDWLITNTPMVRSGGGTIPDLFAGISFLNKPYTISEYNHPFPNRYQSEALIFTTAYSSFHDADAIMFFDYASGPDGWQEDRISSFFSISRNSIMMGLTPSCAYTYRNYLLGKSEKEIIVNYSPEPVQLLPKNDTGGWTGPSFFPRKLALKHAVRTGSFESVSTTDFSSLPPEPVSPYITDNNQIVLSSDGLLTASSGYFSGITGLLNNFHGSKSGYLTIISANGFGSLTWVTLTGDSLDISKRSLLTAASAVQNTGMIWDGIRTIHDNWGSEPSLVNPLYLTLELDIKADSIRVYPLDNTGKDGEYFITYYPAGENKFRVVINQNLSYTLWFGIEAYGSAINNPPEDEIPAEYGLGQNYPNPFNSSTNFEYLLPREEKVSIELFDILGRKVDTLVDSLQKEGIYRHQWVPGNSTVSGVYLLRMTTPNFASTKKLVFIK